MTRENPTTEHKKTFRFIQPVIDRGVESVMDTEISFSPAPEPGLDTNVSKLIAQRIAEEFGAWLIEASPEDLEAARKHGLAGWEVAVEDDGG